MAKEVDPYTMPLCAQGLVNSLPHLTIENAPSMEPGEVLCGVYEEAYAICLTMRQDSDDLVGLRCMQSRLSHHAFVVNASSGQASDASSLCSC